MAGESGTEPAKYQYNYPQDMDVEVFADMVGHIVNGYSNNRFLATVHIARAYRQNERSHYFNLGSINLRRFSEKGKGTEFPPMFDNEFGSLLFTSELPNSPLGEFFRKDGRVFTREDGTLELRGPNYFINTDSNPSRKSTSTKLSIIEDDLQDAFAVIQKVDRENINNERDFILYLGVLDYIKNHSITLFNIYSFRERHTPSDLSVAKYNDPGYLTTRKHMEVQTINSVKMFYLACIGRDFDEKIKLTDMLNTFRARINDIRGLPHRQRKSHSFSFLEVNHPLTVLLAANEAADKYNEKIDTIAGIQSGGVESAIALQLAFEVKKSKSPPIVFAPVSVHTNLYAPQTVDHITNVLKKYADDVTNKHILLVDDNANTGGTLELFRQAAKNLGSKSDVPLIVQYDPGRIINLFDRGQRRLFPIHHPQEAPPLGITDAWAINKIGAKLEKYHQQKASEVPLQQ